MLVNFKIRKMKKQDIEDVQNVARKSWNATYEGIIPDQIQQSFLNLVYSDVMMEQRLSQSLFLVAEVDNRVVGFANYSPVNDAGKVELSAIYIYPDYQGIGVGTALLKEGIKLSAGVKEIYIDVEQENGVGRSFYQTKGFTTVDKFDEDFNFQLLFLKPLKKS